MMLSTQAHFGIHVGGVRGSALAPPMACPHSHHRPVRVPNRPACLFRPRTIARRTLVGKAYEQNESYPGRDPSLEEYVEVKVDSVRVSQGASVVYLRVLDTNLVIQVHIGEHESNALLKEINKQKQLRPLTHDVTKNMMAAIGYKVTKIRVTEIVANTYYARIHLGKPGDNGSITEEVDVDARPSDAINLAVRFGAPMYVNKKIAEIASSALVEPLITTNETQQEIVRTVRDALANFDDPTVMFQLQKDLAIKEERFEDAQTFQQHIVHEMTHNQVLRVVVAMESALSDGRYDEAARLRDEYIKMKQSKVTDRKL